MPVLKRRSRIVSFRLSPEEYDLMRERCLSAGARSVSDYARTSACRRGNHFRFEGGTQELLHKLRQRIEDLDREVRRLVRLVDVPAAPDFTDASPRDSCESESG